MFVNLPSGPEPRAPNADPPAGAAFNDTLLAGKARAASATTAHGFESPKAREPIAKAISALPLEIQGIWVGLACIVLLVISAAALRSLFSPGNVDAQPTVAASASDTASASAVPTAPTSIGALAPTSTGTSVSIGGPGNGNAGLGGNPFGALAIRDSLSKDVQLRKIGAFMDHLEKLIEIEPSAIDRPDVRRLMADAAVASLIGGMNADAERFFLFLSTRAGPAGPDVLFELITTRGGTRAAAYAEELLRREDVRAKGTPAFKVAYDMKTATTCQARQAMFERVKKEGDLRCNQFLFQMAKCGKGPTDCCVVNDPAYKEVVRVLNAKK